MARKIHQPPRKMHNIDTTTSTCTCTCIDTIVCYCPLRSFRKCHLSRSAPVPYFLIRPFHQIRPTDSSIIIFLGPQTRQPTKSNRHLLFIPSLPQQNQSIHSLFRIIIPKHIHPIMFLVQKKYLLVVFFALCVGSAQSQCRLADNCNECLNIADPGNGARCTVSQVFTNA